VYVFATHPVFAPEAPDILQNSKIKKIFVTDTINLRDDQKFEKLEIVSVAPLITSNL
jgi:ribose-phosphate pyrophosphokinase